MTLNLELSLSSELRGVHGREVNGQRLEDLSSEVYMAERLTVRDWKSELRGVHGREGNGPRLEMWNDVKQL